MGKMKLNSVDNRTRYLSERNDILVKLSTVYKSKPEWRIFWEPTKDWLRKLQNEGKLDASVIIPD